MPGGAGASARVAAPLGTPSPGVLASHATAAREWPASLRRVSKNAGRWPRRAATASQGEWAGSRAGPAPRRRRASGRARSHGEGTPMPGDWVSSRAGPAPRHRRARGRPALLVSSRLILCVSDSPTPLTLLPANLSAALGSWDYSKPV